MARAGRRDDLVREATMEGLSGPPWSFRSEIVLRAHLHSTGVGDHAGRRTEVRVSPVTRVVAAEIVPVERVEDVEREPEVLRRSEVQEILPDAKVDALVREKSGHREPATLV